MNITNFPPKILHEFLVIIPVLHAQSITRPTRPINHVFCVREYFSNKSAHSLTLSLDGGTISSTPSCFTRGEKVSCNQWTGVWVSSGVSLNVLDKRRISSPFLESNDDCGTKAAYLTIKDKQEGTMCQKWIYKTYTLSHHMFHFLYSSRCKTEYCIC